MRRLAGRRLRRRRAGAGKGTLIISASRERQAELLRRISRGEGLVTPGL
jgi:hypothetical protein